MWLSRKKVPGVGKTGVVVQRKAKAKGDPGPLLFLPFPSFPRQASWGPSSALGQVDQAASDWPGREETKTGGRV